MEIIKTTVNDFVELRPNIFGDKRGYFFESFNLELFKKVDSTVTFVQDNESFSAKGVLRGLHFQKPPYTQAKLVRVVKGKVLDVAVDLRKNSATYGQYASVLLDANLHNMAYVPEGFAHGFYTIEDAIFQYKCSNYYHKESEGGIIWNDSQLAIDWQLDRNEPLISEKDSILPKMSEFKICF